jgi:hypothetical protein
MLSRNGEEKKGLMQNMKEEKHKKKRRKTKSLKKSLQI